MRESNIDSLENLKTNLRINRIDPDKVAIVFQLNKRDLPNVDSPETMSEYLKTNGAPLVEAAAKEGVGVTQTLRAAVARMLDNLKNNVDTTLYDQPELRAPDMTAKAGVTTGSAGTPKLSMKTGAGTTPTPGAPAPPVASAPAPAVAAAPMPVSTPVSSPVSSPMSAPAFAAKFDNLEAEAEEDPFGAAVAVAEPEAEPESEGDPFGSHAHAPEAFATSEHPDNPFGVVEAAEEPETDPHPFGVTAAVEEPAPSAQPFAITTAVHDESAEREELETMLANARRVVQSLEAALEHARANEWALSEKIARR
jgi:hypothetical protein